MSRTPELRQRVFVHIQQASFEPGPPTQQSGAPEKVGGVKLFRERSSTIGGGGGEGRYYFESEGPKSLAPLRLTARKSCPLQKCVPKKL